MVRSNPSSSKSSERRICLLSAATFGLLWYLLHFVVIGAGAGELWDESRFLHCAEAVRSLADGDIPTASKFSISGTQARPMSCLTWTPHLLVYKSVGYFAGHEQAIRWALVGNLFWWILLVGLTFEIAVLCFGLSPVGAFAVTVLLGGSFSASVNIKHFFPYDAALVISLGGLVLSHRMRCSPKGKACMLGAAASSAFLDYPGYYFVYLLLAANAFHPIIRGREKLQILVLWYTLGCILPLAVFELWAAVGGLSLSAGLRHLSGTISAGSYKESLTFPLKYAIHAEGALGVAVSAILSFSCLGRVKDLLIKLRGEGLRSLSRGVPLGDLLLATMLVCGVLHSVFGFFFHWLVWYRRLLHLFLPWIAIAVVRSFRELQARQAFVCLVSIVIVSVASAVQHVVLLGHIGYPRDVLLALGGKGKVVNKKLEGSLLGCWPTTVDWRYAQGDVLDDPEAHPRFFLRNFCSGFVSEGVLAASPPVGSKLVYSVPHYETLPVYQYDGMDPALRRTVGAHRPSIQVFDYGSLRDHCQTLELIDHKLSLPTLN